MKTFFFFASLFSGILPLLVFPLAFGQQLFEIPHQVQSRWISFENPTGAKGEGGKANKGRKGAPSRLIKSGELITLAEIEGPGVIRRLWLTTRREPEILRGAVIRIYWDNQTTPSVEAPLQDFFGIPFARPVPFESSLFANPEGRSFNCFIPMPFKNKAHITFENQSPLDTELFFDVDYTIGDKLPDLLCYFHAHFRRENPATPKQDFMVLPLIQGEGRYLGCNIGVRSIGEFQEPVWFGEGELKIYLDGDTSHPTLVGTGTEDLVGSAWGLGKFNHLYQGCLLSAAEDGVWGFYRYHIPDAVYFHKEIRVVLQQIAGLMTQDYPKQFQSGNFPELVETHRKFDPARDANLNRWANFEVPQDVCATAYWYQTLPAPKFSPLDSYADRVKDLTFPAKKNHKP
jgi:hypothetical protein